MDRTEITYWIETATDALTESSPREIAEMMERGFTPVVRILPVLHVEV